MTFPLLDTFKRPLRDLRISVTDRCNFRCGYCMPEEIFHERYKFLPKERLLTFEEIERVTRLIVASGAVKLRLTGGEPLMRQEVETLVGMLAQIEGVDDFAMTTNGYFLPQKAQLLKVNGLHRLTVSLDSLDDETFQRMNGRKSSVEKVLKGLEAAEHAGFEHIKINCVVQRGVNDTQLVGLARFCRDRGYHLRLIECMDVGNMNGGRMEHVGPASEIVDRIGSMFPLMPIERDYDSETALRFTYADGAGSLGVIASVTKPFCGACSRLRMSPEGQLFTCLFATRGTDLRTPLREGATDAELSALIGTMWHKRKDRYSEQRSSHPHESHDKVEMYYIGG